LKIIKASFKQWSLVDQWLLQNLKLLKLSAFAIDGNTL